jgi:mono/diheme cytochrome c family protein
MREQSTKSSVPMIQGALLAILFAGLAVMLHAQQAKPVIKTVPPTQTSPAEGAEMFKAYCAACHGLDAKGNGPAVPALKKAPGDLTMLTKNAGGKFPELRVYNAIRGDSALPAHGSKDMPVWGEVFKDLDRASGVSSLRLRNLTMHIQSIQAK